MRLYLSLFAPAEHLPTFGGQLVYSGPLALAFGILVYFTLDKTPASAEPTTTEATNILTDRLPHSIRGPVQHLEMQDHYVKATTTQGSELVLMRMADAVAALADTNGIQIHRSYWINPKFAQSHTRKNGQAHVVMQDGTEFPVSRTYVKTAKEMGVI